MDVHFAKGEDRGTGGKEGGKQGPQWIRVTRVFIAKDAEESVV